jgi:hypothetical protein
MSSPWRWRSRSRRHLQAAEFLYAAHTQTTLVHPFKHVFTQEVTYQSLLQNSGLPWPSTCKTRPLDGLPLEDYQYVSSRRRLQEWSTTS